MNEFRKFLQMVEECKPHADKLYIKENMQAGSRLFASMIDIKKQSKLARKELSAFRKKIRDARKK